MTITGIAPVKQAFVRALRDITDLASAVGSGGFHEGEPIPGAEPPYVIYSVAFAKHDYQWGGGHLLRATIDVYVVHRNSVEAQNLDQLILAGLHDVVFDFSGTDPATEQTTLYCRRVLDLSFAGLDESGKKVYQIGGSYEVWTDQNDTA
jgi:hypothetical protein